MTKAYVITAKLADFKPLASRTFVIKGSSTIEELAETVILMFHMATWHTCMMQLMNRLRNFILSQRIFVPGGMTKLSLI